MTARVEHPGLDEACDHCRWRLRELSAARALRGAAVRVTLSLIMLQFRVSPQEV